MSEPNVKKVSVVQINDKALEIQQIDANEDTISATDIGPKIGHRHIQAFLMALGFICGIGTRTNLSVAVVAMTDNSTSPNPDIPAYDWNNTSIILSSFFWSYISLQVVAGYLGKTYGPKYFLLVAIFVNCCACAMTPFAADHLGSSGVILVRIIQGFGQAFLYPSMNVLLGRWAPAQERTTLYNITYAGVLLGTISGAMITGFVSSSWLGWPVSFYILAGMGIAWCIIWLLFGQNSPATDPSISNEERQYIQTSLNQQDNRNLAIPWKKILTCVPFYALILSSVGYNWGYAILMTETPTYLAKVMKYNLKQNAVLTSTLTAVSLVGGLITGPVSDWIISRKILSTLNARRIFNLIGAYGQAFCLIWLSFLKSSQSTLSICVLGLGNALVSFVLVGGNVNHLDLSPRFSGIIYGIMNAIGMGVSIIGTLTANWIITDTENTSQWQTVYLIAAAFLISGGTIFFFFASATRQSWDGEQITIESEIKERRKKISVVSLMSM